MNQMPKFEITPMNKAKRSTLDSAFVLLKSESFFTYAKYQGILGDLGKKGKKSILFSGGKAIHHFFTEDSKLYITPGEQKLIDAGMKLNRPLNKWDSLSLRIVKNYQHYQPGSEDVLSKAFARRYQTLRKTLKDGSQSIIDQWSLVKLWNFSLVGAIILGMFSMTLIYRFLGPGALAGKVTDKDQSVGIIQTLDRVPDNPAVLGAATIKGEIETKDLSEYIEKITLDLENSKKDEFEKKVRSMVKGYPIEKMVPYILEKDQIVAAFLIGIARKESSWGVHVPVLDGQDCYNYWGYRGQRKLMGTGGHTCFNSRKDAVDTVAKRIEWLVENQNRNTPDKMIIWKCGSACNKDNPEAVRKWISDVNLYFNKLNK
jgi:hypothetical protein